MAYALSVGVTLQTIISIANRQSNNPSQQLDTIVLDEATATVDL